MDTRPSLVPAAARSWPAPAGLAPLFTVACLGIDLTPVRQTLLNCLAVNAADSAAMMDLAITEQLLRNPDKGLEWQQQALRHDRIYRSSWPALPGALRILAFKCEGDISANTPVEFLLKDSGSILYSYYVDPERDMLSVVPEHDVAIVLVGESDTARPVIAKIQEATKTWPLPVLNIPERILRLSRDQAYAHVAGIRGLVMPGTVRVDRETLATGAADPESLLALLSDAVFPLIVRPVGSHAGRGLAKLESALTIKAYLDEHHGPQFYLSRFVEYRSPDGQYRKYRIVWIDGRAYPVHMAIAKDWKIWYLNANMGDDLKKRAEEAAFITSFSRTFAARHADALSEVVSRFGLDYVGVDCAETLDGSLLLFEADISLAVHDLDSPTVFPYKRPAIGNICSAFRDMLAKFAATAVR